MWYRMAEVQPPVRRLSRLPRFSQVNGKWQKNEAIFDKMVAPSG